MKHDNYDTVDIDQWELNNKGMVRVLCLVTTVVYEENNIVIDLNDNFLPDMERV